MSTNAEVAETFREIADVLDVLGEKFKPEAYRRAARSIESLTEDLRAVAARKELRTIPGVGEAIGEKIGELLTTGHLEYYERLKKEVPPGILDLLKVPGLGPKTARRFWLELGVEGPAELASAIDTGRLAGVKGFGPKKIEQIRGALDAVKGRPSGRLAIEHAFPIAQRLLRGLRESGTAKEVEIAGSFRRCRETVGDLDILATSSEPERVFDTFSGLPEVGSVQLRGGTKETVLLTNGLQVDLRVVEPEEFGAALVYFTGSKDHNVHLRTIARDRGLKINEYGVFRGEERIGGRTEADVYATLQLAWIPPELREDRGEIESAAKGPLPPLVEPRDLLQELHVHLPPKAGPKEVDRLIAEARARRLRYVGCVVASTADGGTYTAPAPVRERLRAAAGRGLSVGLAIEVGPAGPPPDPGGPAYDYAIVRPASGAPDPSRTAAMAPLRIGLVAHVGNGPSARRWIDWARSSGAAIEVGPGPDRLDSSGARVAREAGVPLVVPTGLGLAEDDPTAPIALGFARRAGAGPDAVRNSGRAENVSRGGTPARSG